MTEQPPPATGAAPAERLLHFLAGLSLFSGLSKEALVELVAQVERVSLPGGCPRA